MASKLKLNTILLSDVLEALRTFDDESVNCCITSPPYWGLRDYGVEGQLGLEKKPEYFIRTMVKVFHEVKRVLKSDGTLWVNIGDSYAGSGKAKGDIHKKKYKQDTNRAGQNKDGQLPSFFSSEKYKPKDLIGIPWMLAFALRADGWYLRQDIIWQKPNPMPESVNDRCTKSHEYIFLLSKSKKYYFDAYSIATAYKEKTLTTYGIPTTGYGDGSGMVASENWNRDIKVRKPKEWNIKGYKHRGKGDKKITGHSGNYDANGNLIGNGKANKRSVWTVPTKPFKQAHFATFPEKLITDCIKAGCPEGGVVLDPFMGAGTTALVARKLNRNFIGIEINPEYIEIANRRLEKELGLFQ